MVRRQVTSSSIRVLIADDDPLFSEVVRLQLTQAGLSVVAEAETGDQAIYLVQKLEPDVAVIDIMMPEMDGIEALQAIKQARPATSVVILTAHAKIGFLKEALARGAAAFVTKGEVNLRRLPETVQMVSLGEEIIVDMDLIREALKLNHTSGPNRELELDLEELTDRERAVLQLIGEGLSNRDIAKSLVVSESTVKSHVRHLFTKLDLSDRTQAALFALRHGIAK